MSFFLKKGLILHELICDQRPRTLPFLPQGQLYKSITPFGTSGDALFHTGEQEAKGREIIHILSVHVCSLIQRSELLWCHNERDLHRFISFISFLPPLQMPAETQRSSVGVLSVHTDDRLPRF